MGSGKIECNNGEHFKDGITNGAAWYPSKYFFQIKNILYYQIF